jgi:hypothetical protein
VWGVLAGSVVLVVGIAVAVTVAVMRRGAEDASPSGGSGVMKAAAGALSRLSRTATASRAERGGYSRAEEGDDNADAQTQVQQQNHQQQQRGEGTSPRSRKRTAPQRQASGIGPDGVLLAEASPRLVGSPVLASHLPLRSPPTLPPHQRTYNFGPVPSQLSAATSPAQSMPASRRGSTAPCVGPTGGAAYPVGAAGGRRASLASVEQLRAMAEATTAAAVAQTPEAFSMQGNPMFRQVQAQAQAAQAQAAARRTSAM